MKRVFHLPAYRRLLAAYGLNELAWSFGTLALAVLVYRRTGSATGTAAFFLCSQFVPALISPVFVARIDRRQPRGVLVPMYLIEAATFGFLALLVHRFTLAGVLALAFLDGVMAVSARAIARATSVSVLAPAGLLREGNAVTSTVFAVCFMAGPAIAGAIVALDGTVTALLVDCGLFCAMALILATAKLPAAAEDSGPTAGRLRAALARGWRSARIRNVLSLQVAALVFVTISVPVEVIFAQHTLHAGAGGYGGLLSSWGAGAVGGSIAFARWRRKSLRTLATCSIASAGIGFVIMASAPSLGVAIVGAVLGGLGNGIETIAMQTALQEAIEREWMAMMMSVWESINQAVPGLGIVIGGALTALASARIALAAAGVGTLLIAPAAWLALRAPAVATDAAGAPSPSR